MCTYFFHAHSLYQTPLRRRFAAELAILLSRFSDSDGEDLFKADWLVMIMIRWCKLNSIINPTAQDNRRFQALFVLNEYHHFNISLAMQYDIFAVDFAVFQDMP